MNRKYHLIWSVKEPSLYPPEKNVVFIRRDADSVRWNYYLNHCGFFIFTHPWWLKSWKKSQTVIHTDHGTMPLKAGVVNPPIVFDYLLTGTETTEKYRKLFWGGDKGNYQAVRLDLPRNDWLFDRGDFLRPFLGGQTPQHIILCMPTFKQSAYWEDSTEQNPYFINVACTKADMERLNRFLAEHEALLVCKLHHLQKLDYMTKERFSHILYLTDDQLMAHDIMINHVLTCADALVTDFSSVCFDFMLLDRPVGFFCSTAQQYSRGYLMENPEDFMAWEKIYTLDELIAFIDATIQRKDPYQAQRRHIRDLCFCFKDADNSKRFLDYFQLV